MPSFRTPVSTPLLALVITGCSAFALDPPSDNSTIDLTRDGGDGTSASTTTVVSPTHDSAPAGTLPPHSTAPDSHEPDDTRSSNATTRPAGSQEGDDSSDAVSGATDHDASIPGSSEDVTSGVPDESDPTTYDATNSPHPGTSFEEPSTQPWPPGTEGTGNTDSSTQPPGPDDSTTFTSEPETSTPANPSTDTTSSSSTSSSTTSSSPETTTTGGGDPTTSDEEPEPPEPAPCDPLVTTNAGVHVSPQGNDNAYCGTSDNPCRSISYSMARGAVVGSDVFYLAQGTYAESMSLGFPATFYGGWTPSSGAWTRPCQSLATTTTIASPGAIGLSAQFSGTAELESLQIRTKGRDGNDGSSRYGIFATGSATRLELRDLVVAPGNANHGAAGVAGQDGSPAPSSCEAGGGADGAPATVPPSTSPGVFTQSGFMPGDGANGGNGNSGQNGADGVDVTEICDFCTNCIGAAGGERTAQAGANGCGGGRGTAGSGGSGGGASVGVFVALANVYFGDSVSIFVGSGGDGAGGGDGGDGAAGSNGAAGSDYVCNPQQSNSCNNSCDEVIQSNYGGDGGNGSPGSAGGDGAGGWSVALVGTSGAFSGSSVTPVLGQAGTSQGSGPDGTSQVSVTIN